MLDDADDKKARARAAVTWYIDDICKARPRPDGERDQKLDAILDRLSADLVELAAWLSESAAWMHWASKGSPPLWAIPFLTQEELAGEGPRLPKTVGPEPEQKPTPEPEPKQKKGGRKKKDPWAEVPVLDRENIEYMVEHYNELPTIDHTTGGPAGEVL